MLAPVQAKLCPFCGLATDVPHETQQGCIDALHVEITRMRGLLDTVKPVSEEISTAPERPEADPSPSGDRKAS